jgi:hypothetical protein
MKIYPEFDTAIKCSVRDLLYMGEDVVPNNWQSIDVSKRPEAKMKELLFLNFKVPLPKRVEHLAKQIKPNLPWADKHFELERVSGEPINPGETWKEWPWANSAGGFLTESKQFDHSYAERYWPCFAGHSPDGHVCVDAYKDGSRQGVRGRVGDLNDVVDRLLKDPMTRQAVLSVWHPEDQFDQGQRVPCSLTYQFLQRNGYFHIIYNIRSCDAYRHFRDDLYLTSRLAFWVLNKLRIMDESWEQVNPGFFVIQVGSFHCFVNDINQLRKWV